MKKINGKIITVFILLLCISGCSKAVTNNVSGIKNTAQSYTFKDEIKPISNDDSTFYKNTELTVLNNKNKLRPISTLYFLDDKNIIFSAMENSDNLNDIVNCNLYKYNLDNDELILICPNFLIDQDSYINLKDSDNFSICTFDTYLKIESNKVKTKRNIFIDAKQKFNYVNSVLYNEENNKLLIFEDDTVSKTNGAYICDSKLINSEKLPFNNIYRVQWANNSNVLIAYKQNNQSLLARYNLIDKSIIVTELPVDNYFIDPIRSENNIIRFLYLDNPRTEIPLAFLDLNDSTVKRIKLDNPNPISIIKNGKIAFFSPASANSTTLNNLMVYDITAQKLSVRVGNIELPQALAVSPDGNMIIYVVGSSDGAEGKFMINKKM